MLPISYTTADISEPADPDSFKNSVAGELMHHQGGVEQQGGLVVVGHDASDEVGIGRIEGGEQGVKLGSEGGGDRFENLGPGILSLLLLLGDFFRLSCTEL